jgi:arylsulfatase A-like enzyme
MKMKPNIVILVIDALRPKNMSLFGYKKETDKNIKNLANEAILFTQHISTSNSTTPSLTSLFTGKYPKNNGIIHQFPYIKPEEIEKLKEEKFWLPVYLNSKGYDTIGIDWIGLWFKRGFNYYEEKEDKPKGFLNNERVRKLLLSLPSWTYKLGKKLIKKRASASFPPVEKTIELAIDKIKNSNKPFFLFMHLWDTHFPFPTTQNPENSYEKDMEKIIENIKEDSQKEYVKKRIADINIKSSQGIIDKYDLAVKNVDANLGKLIDFMKHNEMWENTLFIVLGDHGDSLTEHGIYFSHSGLYDESIHVPLIMKIPKLKGKKINELVQNVDIAPTILEILGDKQKLEFDGKSLMPLIKNGKKIRKFAFSNDGLAENISSIRTKNRKLIISKDSKCHLCKSNHHIQKEEYDLIKDGNELDNIYSENSKLEKKLE